MAIHELLLYIELENKSTMACKNMNTDTVTKQDRDSLTNQGLKTEQVNTTE